MPIFQITYTKPFLNKFLYCDFLLFSLNLWFLFPYSDVFRYSIF
jgi:hypothetical protein